MTYIAPIDLNEDGSGPGGGGGSGGQLPGSTFSLVSSPSVVTNGNSSVLTPNFNYINIEYAYIGTGGEDSSDISSSVSSGTAITVTPDSSAITTYTLTVAYTRYANIYDTVGTLIKTSVNTSVEAVSAATLTSLTASPTDITTGDSTVLTGVFSNGTGIITRNTETPIFLSMTSGVGLTVYPSVTTTYTLTVTNLANDQVTENVTVTVGAVPSAVSLVPTASSINYGASTTLTPTFSGGTGVVTPGSISVTSGTPITVSPTSTTTYTLTVTNSAGLTSTTTGTVTVVALPVATSLTPGASSITSGSSTTLTPTFSDGTAKIGTTAGGDQITSSITSGTAVTISPTSTTTYYLTVTNSLGTTASTSTAITVIGVPVATSLAPGTATLTNGDSTTIIPIFSGGTGTVSPTVGSVTSGDTYTVSPTTTTTYTLTVTNTLGASTTTSSTITVIAAPSPVPTANPIEFYVRNPNNQPSKVKEFYLMDSAQQWRLIKEGWFFDGSAWRQIFKYDPSIIVVSNNPVKPVSADESGFTGSGESKSNKNNSFDTATISDSTTYGEWIANGTTGNTITWTWDNTTPSPAYTTISFNARIQILNFTTAVNSGQGDCKRYDCCDENGDRYCAEWAPAFASPSSILFEYTLNGQNPSPTWVSFQGFLSSVDSSFTGTVYSSDITSGIPSNISNLKIRATVSCPTGGVSNGTATLRVYDVWISTVSGSAAVPPTITSFAPVNNLITTGSNGALVSIFSPNGGATISSATISENGSTIATLSTSTGSNTITTTIATPSSGTHTYTLTVTDSNSNTSSKDTNLSVASSPASSPSILLSYFNNSTNAFTTPSNNVTNFKLDPNKEIIITASFTGVAGQSVVSVTSGSASDAGLPSPWTPSSSPGYYYIIPKAVGTYTFTNTLNGGSPTATATLQVVEAEPTPINATSYNPISKNAALYREYEYVNGTLNTLTPKAVELSIVCNFTVQNYSSGTVVAKWQRKENISDSWVDYQTSDFTNLLASLIVTQLGYYRIKITNTIGSTTVTTYSDEFTVVQRDRIRPSGSFSEVIKPIGYISQGNPGILTLESRDLSLDGLSGVISITDTLSMYQLNGRTVTLTEVETNFSLKGYRYALSENGQNLNTSNFDPFRYVSPSANGIITVKNIWDEDNKAADWLTVNSATGSIVTTTTPHGFSSGQKVLFTNILGLIELNSQILTIQGITDEKTFTINLSGAARPYNQNYKGYVIGVDTYAQAPSSIVIADPNDSADFLYAEETVSLNFPRLEINGSIKLYLRAGFEYSSGPGTFEGNTQYLSLAIKNKGIDVRNIINVTMPSQFDGYNESSPWGFGPQNTIENNSVVINNVENLNDISIVLNSAGGTENRIIEDPENPITYQSGSINIYDCYAIIRPGITPFDPYDADTIYPSGS